MGLRFRRFNLVLGLLTFSTIPALAAPHLRLSQTAVGPVSVAVGQNGTAPAVDAANVGDGNLNLRVESSVPWIVPRVGATRNCSLRGACLPIEFSLQTATLARGMHTGVVTVSDPNAVDAPQTITVTVQVGGGVPEKAELWVAPGRGSELTFTTTSSLQTATSTESGGNWLAVGLSGGGSFQFGVPAVYRLSANAGSLGEGTYTGRLVVSGSQIPTENTTVPVTLRVTNQPILRLNPERVAMRVAQNGPKQVANIVYSNGGNGTLSLSGATASTASGGNWLAATVYPEYSVVQATADPAGLAPGTYNGALVLAGNAAQGNVSVPVQLVVVAAGPPVLSFGGVVNNATFEGGDRLAFGGLVAMFGEQLASGEPVTGPLPLATEVGAVKVFVNDRPAPIWYVSYSQINFQIPYDAQPGPATIRIERAGQRSNSISATLARSVPRLLRSGIGEYGNIQNPDYSFPMPVMPGVNSHPAKAGDALVIYALALGPTDPPVDAGAKAPASPLASVPGNWKVLFGTANPFGGEAAEATPFFVGLTPGYTGLYQINVIIPPNAPRGDNVPLVLVGDGGSSNRVTVAIQ